MIKVVLSFLNFLVYFFDTFKDFSFHRWLGANNAGIFSSLMYRDLWRAMMLRKNGPSSGGIVVLV